VCLEETSQHDGGAAPRLGDNEQSDAMENRLDDGAACTPGSLPLMQPTRMTQRCGSLVMARSRSFIKAAGNRLSRRPRAEYDVPKQVVSAGGMPSTTESDSEYDTNNGSGRGLVYLDEGEVPATSPDGLSLLNTDGADSDSDDCEEDEVGELFHVVPKTTDGAANATQLFKSVFGYLMGDENPLQGNLRIAMINTGGMVAPLDKSRQPIPHPRLGVACKLVAGGSVDIMVLTECHLDDSETQDVHSFVAQVAPNLAATCAPTSTLVSTLTEPADPKGSSTTKH